MKRARARAARAMMTAMMTAMRVAGDKKGKGSKATRVAGETTAM
jgi:hypothetical protein